MEQPRRVAALTTASQCRIERVDATGAIHVDGEIDVSSSMWVADALVRSIDGASDDGIITLDLSQVAFIDASGLGALVEARNAARARGCELRVVDPSPRVRRIIDLTDTASMFEVASSP